MRRDRLTAPDVVAVITRAGTCRHFIASSWETRHVEVEESVPLGLVGAVRLEIKDRAVLRFMPAA